jgi:signal transduction histidine kinase
MSRPLIYCIEDREDMQALYKYLLVSLGGYEIGQFFQGGEALIAIRKQPPDCILLDEDLMDMSGMEVCRILRQDPSLPFVPIIMVSGYDVTHEKIIQRLESGIDDFIEKPFNETMLLAKIHVMLRFKKVYEDLNKTRKSLVQAEKLAAVGQLAAAMAHEIRNPLSIIGASVQYVKSQNQDEEQRSMLDTMLRKITDIDITIRELLTVARPFTIKKERLNVSGPLRKVTRFIREKCLMQEVQCETDIPEDLPEILGDEDQLERACLNILINALNSMPQGGRLQVTARAYPERQRLEMRFEDSGCGVAMEDLERLFEPFFTKMAGGSGLGLFIVKMIVDEMEGKIEVSSEPGKGTRFVLSFPTQNMEKKLKFQEAATDTVQSK